MAKSASGAAAGNGAPKKGFFGHPKGLAVLFMTEMWERFSYYGMRALLVFYLTKHWLFNDQFSTALYGTYTALVYVTPVIGGILADRYLGSRKAVTIGALLLVAGHFGMAFEGERSEQYISYQGAEYLVEAEGRGEDLTQYIATEEGRYQLDFTAEGISVSGADGDSALPALIPQGEYSERIVRDPFFLNFFYMSLALIIMGVGFLKANISTIVGALYEPGDRRRDGGFTIFYMGINLGALVAPLICGYLGETYGWKYGFGLAGIGMLAGLVVFLRGQPLLAGRADPPDAKKLKERVFALFTREHFIWLGALAGVGIVWLLVQNPPWVQNLLTGFGLTMIAVIMLFSFLKCEREERDRMIVASVLIAFSILFWSLFEQAGSSLNLLADRNVDREVAGFVIPATVFQSVNPGFIVLLAPFFTMLWGFLGNRGWEPSIPVKFSIGLMLAGLGFLVIVYGAHYAGPGGELALIWLVLVYLLHTMGELCLSPVGLSMVTKLSVARVVGMMMGTWFLASASANFIAGQIAALTGAETVGGEVVDKAAYLDNTMDVYQTIGLIGIGFGVFALLISPLLRKGMHGVR